MFLVWVWWKWFHKHNSSSAVCEGVWRIMLNWLKTNIFLSKLTYLNALNVFCLNPVNDQILWCFWLFLLFMKGALAAGMSGKKQQTIETLFQSLLRSVRSTILVRRNWMLGILQCHRCWMMTHLSVYGTAVSGHDILNYLQNRHNIQIWFILPQISHIKNFW